MNKLKALFVTLGFPIYSLLNPRIGFTVFYPTTKGWRVYTRGRTIPVRGPALWTLEYYRQYVPLKGAIVFDVGGELGYETEQFSELVGSKGRVYTFECMPSHVAHLKSIAEKRKNVTVIESACWNTKTTLEFSVGKTPGSGTAVPEAKGQQGQSLADAHQPPIVVSANTLDSLWQEYANKTQIDFLKMDIEGAEYEAIEGGKKALEYTKVAVIAAYHIRDGVRTADRVAAQMANLGFKVRIDENHHVYCSR